MLTGPSTRGSTFLLGDLFIVSVPVILSLVCLISHKLWTKLLNNASKQWCKIDVVHTKIDSFFLIWGKADSKYRHWMTPVFIEGKYSGFVNAFSAKITYLSITFFRTVCLLRALHLFTRQFPLPDSLILRLLFSVTPVWKNFTELSHGWNTAVVTIPDRVNRMIIFLLVGQITATRLLPASSFWPFLPVAGIFSRFLTASGVGVVGLYLYLSVQCNWHLREKKNQVSDRWPQETTGVCRTVELNPQA